MISVVTPLFNKEPFIAETIQSILDQTYSQFELIVVNDGSTDNSLQRVEAFKDERINIITIPNSGVSVARNTGIKNASYSWIAFLDADDWWAPTFLEEIVNAIANYPDNAVFATGRSRVFKDFSERYDHDFLPDDGKTEVLNYYSVISRYLPLVNSSNSCFQKSLFKEQGVFKEGQKKHEDHDLWMRLCVNEPVVFINKNLSLYQKTETNSASSAKYEAKDFITYLRTIKVVKESVNSKERAWFQRYINSFVTITYIQNYACYTKHEDREVSTLAKLLTTGKWLLLIKFLRLLPFKNIYGIFKFLKR